MKIDHQCFQGMSQKLSLLEPIKLGRVRSVRLTWSFPLSPPTPPRSVRLTWSFAISPHSLLPARWSCSARSWEASLLGRAPAGSACSLDSPSSSSPPPSPPSGWSGSDWGGRRILRRGEKRQRSCTVVRYWNEIEGWAKTEHRTVLYYMWYKNKTAYLNSLQHLSIWFSSWQLPLQRNWHKIHKVLLIKLQTDCTFSFFSDADTLRLDIKRASA